MNTHLTRFAVILCMAVQAWLGCARGPGMFVCMHTGFADPAPGAITESSDVHAGCCGHHRPVDPPAQNPAPAHDENCPSCIDLTLPGTAVLTARDASTDHLTQTVHAAVLWVPLPIEATFVLPAQRCPPWGVHGAPDSAKARASCGIATTRLLV